MYSGMRNALIAECFPILFHLLSGTILTRILEVMLTDPIPVKSDIKQIVKGLISNEDMILARAGQFKQLSREPEKFR